MNGIPTDVIAWLREVFSECNARISEKLSANPNLPEESLDLTWIEHVSRYSSPITLSSNWSVKIETHYLGGVGHFYRWEVADIGVLLFLRRGWRLERSKVALLQSKRLYPANSKVSEEGKVDYEIGFARLADPEDLARSIAVEAEFNFTEKCRYGALVAQSEQVEAITEYEKQNRLRIYYQLYNPWSVPFVQRVPLAGYSRPQESSHWESESSLPRRFMRCSASTRKATVPDLKNSRTLCRVCRRMDGPWNISSHASSLPAERAQPSSRSARREYRTSSTAEPALSPLLSRSPSKLPKVLANESLELTSGQRNAPAAPALSYDPLAAQLWC